MNEIFVRASDLLSMGFTSDRDISNFNARFNIQKDPRGYPLVAIVRAMNEVRKARLTQSDINLELMKQRVRKEQVATDIKLRVYIERSLAIDRIRTICQATAHKIRCAIKLAAPKVIGIMSVTDVENILTEGYNLSIEDLLREADTIQSWEDYGYTNSQPTGNEVVEDSEEGSSNGDSQESPSVITDEYNGTDRSELDSLFGRPD